MRWFRALRGTIVSILLFANLLLFGILILLFGSLVWLNPIRSIRKLMLSWLLYLPYFWSRLNHLFISFSTFGKWNVEGSAELSKKKWYLLLSNHQSWFDILVIDSFFSRKIPILKFFMKQELLWTLPFAGFACYFLGFPFMRRHTPSEIKKRPELKGKDIETVKKACDKFKVLPTTVMIFAEGTRFSEQKREQMQSPYRHLLKAKGAGAAIVLSELEQELAGIINVTVDYSTEQIGMWKLLCGDFKQLTLRYELLPINSELIGDFYQDRQYRKRFTAWLNELWAAKDQQLEELRDGSNPTPSDTAKPNGDVAS